MAEKSLPIFVSLRANPKLNRSVNKPYVARGEMMGTLRDEVYENLDYFSQLTEVVIGPQNEALSRAPDRFELDFTAVNKLKDRSWGARGFEVNVQQVLASVLAKSDHDALRDIHQYFELQISEDFELDLVNQTMTGTLALVKKVQQIDEKKVLELAVDRACAILSYYDWPTKRVREKVATVLNTLEPGRGTEWQKTLEGRAAYQACAEIQTCLKEVILENKWRVRDSHVIAKIGSWIQQYLADTNDTSTGLVNLIKLKMMIDKDLPVYSVDEVKRANPV